MIGAALSSFMGGAGGGMGGGDQKSDSTGGVATSTVNAGMGDVNWKSAAQGAVNSSASGSQWPLIVGAVALAWLLLAKRR